MRLLLSDRRFVGAVLAQGFVYAALFAYLSGATYVLQGVYGLSPQQYALAFGLNSAGFMVFGYLAGRSSERWSVIGTLVIGLIVAGVGAAGLLAAGLTHMPLIVVIVSLLLLVSGTAITSPPSTTLALVRLPADRRHRLLAARRGPVRVRRHRRPARRRRRRPQHPAPRPRHHDVRRPRSRRRSHLPRSPNHRDRRRHVPHPHNGRNTHMRGVIMYAPGDVRVEQREDPVIEQPTDAIIRVTAACICGSDLWPYRGIEPVNGPTPMGHEYVGVVEQIGDDVNDVTVGDFVVGSFFASDNTCEICQAGYQSRCVHAVPMGSIGTQAELLRVPLADGTLVATPGHARPRADPGAARRLRCARHRLVRRRRSRSRPRQDRRRRR